MGECWLEYDSTRLYTLLVRVLTKTHTTAHDAHTNVQVLAEYGSTTLHTSLVLVLTNNRTIRTLIDQSLMCK
jgi:hypothetical protein